MFHFIFFLDFSDAVGCYLLQSQFLETGFIRATEIETFILQVIPVWRNGKHTIL